MSWNNKVVWSEGLFLRPQHLQQADRYMEGFVRGRTAALRGYGWGFTDLRLNRSLLTLGKVAIEHAAGVLEDGTPFAIPDEADQPAPLEVPESLRNVTIHLALPASQPGAVETESAGSSDAVARFALAEQEVVGGNAGERDPVAIEVGRLRFRLVAEGMERSGFLCMPVARLVEVRANRQVVLDESFVPPALDIAAAPVIAGYATEIEGLLHHRGEALAGRVSQSGTKGVAEIADFLLLQVVNRHEPLFAHLGQASTVHPETLFGHMLQLAGELATFSGTGKRPPSFGPYRHEDLATSFRPLMQSIRQSLNTVLEQTAIAIPLRETRYGVHLAEVMDRSLFRTAAFVLAVRADVEAERLRRAFPTQVKIGPAERIKDLVNVALPGMVLDALPVAPRQIPFHAGVTYFEIDRNSAYWKEMPTSGGLALHVAGDFPNLEMALWAIRGDERS
ncbi:type VI secretion system baseplate subunit TssK [Arenibaculum pallidiluteum]|uniref:type VI secretion system baseplate subunit TssK n=1 Tax=Arenibaculum pallidiluteum TaxID=2812559 RepID=UPI001A96C5CD|nr:type VI secretion system baseplate subunit TssK [Arenibaculum pallidiluteum]